MCCSPGLWPLVLFGCFVLPVFVSSDDSPLPLHPLSPPHSLARAKRQAYQVYLGGETSVSVDRGQVDSGPWGDWTQERQCSRTCGGGVYVERRICSGACTGPSIRYVSCNVEPCPADAKDFRAEQCAAHNDDPLDGHYYKWVPYAGKNKCELTCRPEEANFYYNWAEKVVDGTRCDAFGDDICVDGICLPVGCDGRLGSEARKDKCGVCQGDGSRCKTVEGMFDERALAPGYHDIVAIPAEATAIHVEEMRPSSNVFAIKNATGHFFLNGNFQIQVLSKNIRAGGAAFKYEKGDGGTERLTANGPLKEAITIALLLQRAGGTMKHSAVKYEYSVPLEQDVKYLYKPGEWSGCSVTCGKGVRTRALYCIDMATQQRVDDTVCDENNATKPEFERPCTTVDCEPEWFTGDWEACSATCGDRGVQFRVLYCHRVFADGRRMTVPDANCTERGQPRAALSQQCNRFSCPEWQAGPWSACSSQCGDAQQFRSVTCRSAKEGEEARLLAAEACTGERPAAERPCNLGPCEGLRFHTTDWDLCQKCNDTEETRKVTCVDKNAREYPLEKCLDGKKGAKIPEDTRPCASQAPCIYEWHTSQWSKCSTECGHGHKSRKVFCAINELGETKRVDGSLCAGEKPVEREECVNEEKCTGTYFSGPWTECSAQCDGGKQTRAVVCLNYDRKPVPEWCDEKERPPEEQECNTNPCPKCADHEHGCCPDGVAFAAGPFYAGCSNCSLSEHGCCADNVTERADAKGANCPDYVAAAEGEGSGEEPSEVSLESATAEALCEVENKETMEKLQVPCAATIASALLEAVEEDANATAANVTKHCSKTEHGCCPDWYTSAEGPNFAGCPTFVLGACNETKHGCCPDGVTLSRGPDFEGCGEPTCAASMFGCCKDRRTIAFGTHYAGCERSSFPCELSQHGCCEDGETAALGPNGTGCGASCLLTRYGCCPDGKTHAKGANNEGCGCAFAQYGCCPDGKNAAKGPGFYGCPESCAQSKFGCCPDGKTLARGPNKEGCPCQYTRWGCCQDGETTALGPLNEGCDDCRYAKYGCCPDGESKAHGPDYAGCPSTTPAPYIVGGTVSPSSIVSCSLPQDQGQVCAPGYKLVWFYDAAEGRCSQFWFGGCGGNENRFSSKEQCEQICVEPPHIGRCYLPKVEGPQRCTQLAARYWYDYATKQCSAFWWRGCLGNANNFASWEECQSFCAAADPSQVSVPQFRAPVPHAHPPPAPQQQQPAPVSILPVPSVEEIVERPAPPAARGDEDPCRLSVDSGNCQNYVDQYYFDAFAGACYRFIYSGCGGNRNRFASEAECAQRCGHLTKPGFLGHKQSVPASSAAMPKPKVEKLSAGRKAMMKTREVCSLRPDIGKCEGHFESWYYEVASGQCERFSYSGCGGNANRFSTLDECQALCLRRSDDYPPQMRLGPPSGAAVSAFGPPQHTEGVGQMIGRVGAKAHLAPICEAPKDSGSCKHFSTKWYYNRADGTCTRFHYGGCEGNGNRFETEQECKNTCGEYKDVCSLPVVPGPCMGKIARFAFDVHTRQCTPFEFGGCLGNNNNFRSVEDCRARCQPTLHNTTNPPTIVRRPIRANPPLEEAESPNERNEEEEMDSAETVVVSADHLLYGQLPELCLLEEQRGTCFGEMLRYRFDPEVGDCVGLLYTGCAGNANNFLSYEACARACGQWKSDRVCEQPVDDGRAQCPDKQGVSVPKWHFDAGRGKCAMFFWSGCAGNGNRFQSKSECENLCARETLALWDHRHNDSNNLCRMPMDGGPCSDLVTMWYHDPDAKQCRRFTFGGCRGNANRFVTREDCEAQCVSGDQQQQQRGGGGELIADRTSAAAPRVPVQQWPNPNPNQPQQFRRPRIFAFPVGTLLSGGTNLTLRCVRPMEDASEAEQQQTATFTWFKDGREMALPGNEGTTAPHTRRMQEFSTFLVGELLIRNVTASDRGAYACSFGRSFISEAIQVRVKEGPILCDEDNGPAEVCQSVLRTGLCSTLRYGKYCCRTCYGGGEPHRN